MMVDCVSVLHSRYPALLDCETSPFFDDGDGVIYYLPSHWPDEMTVTAPSKQQVATWIQQDLAWQAQNGVP